MSWVMVPMHRLKISMMPKWMVFMPKAWQTGKKMGVKIRQAGVISIKVPTTSRMMLMRNRITYLLLLMESRALDTRDGMLVNAMTQDMMLVSGGTSVAALFMAGYLPGILWGLACMIVIYFFAKKHGYRSKTSFTFKEAIHTILQAIPALLLIIIVIGAGRQGSYP